MPSLKTCRNFFDKIVLKITHHTNENVRNYWLFSNTLKSVPGIWFFYPISILSDLNHITFLKKPYDLFWKTIWFRHLIILVSRGFCTIFYFDHYVSSTSCIVSSAANTVVEFAENIAKTCRNIKIRWKNHMVNHTVFF